MELIGYRMSAQQLDATFAALADPDAAGHPRAPGARRGIGDGARRAVRDEPAGHLEAPGGAGARRADLARPRRAAAAVPDRGRAAWPRRAAGSSATARIWEGNFRRLDALLEELAAPKETERQQPKMENVSDRKRASLEARRQRIVITRCIRCARAALVFDAYTKPDLVKRWLLGPAGWSMPVCEIDLKVGGASATCGANPTRAPTWECGGMFREIVAAGAARPHRAVRRGLDRRRDAGDDDLHGGGGRTVVAMTVLYASAAGPRGALGTGMTRGMGQSYERLDEVLAAERPRRARPEAPPTTDFKHRRRPRCRRSPRSCGSTTRPKRR